MKIEQIDIKHIKPNKGQVEGVPKNPRTWDRSDVEALASSIEETAELIEARPLLVYKLKANNYVVLGGNMRLEALKLLGMEKVPCMVFEGLETAKIKEIVLKDNSSFGDWDTDELANMWSDYDLEGWGVKGIAGVDAPDFGDKNMEIDTDEWSDKMSLKFKLHPEEYDFVVKKMEGKDARVELLKLVGYGE